MFDWLVFFYLCVALAREAGLPVRIGQALQVAALLLMLLALLGVLPGRLAS